MSDIETALAWYPPEFPIDGRLPNFNSPLIPQNYRQLRSQENDYQNQLCETANKRVLTPCSRTLHISLFFDGTGNNLNHDLFKSEIKHPTNVARLFRATIGTGYAAGVDDENASKSELFDSAEMTGSQYYKYYIPGVGTPCPEVMDLNYSMRGLAFAIKGEARLNWMLLRLVDALRRSFDLSGIDHGSAWQSVQKMSSPLNNIGFSNHKGREKELQRLLCDTELQKQLTASLNATGNTTSRLLGIKLYLYGFSRGAAAARSFVSWLSELLPRTKEDQDKAELCLMAGTLKIPLQIEFLGLFDTVASVGIAHIAPVAEGHMGWADGTQELPSEATYQGWVKRCVHLVSSHEQRLSFPLDSIRRTDGTYPKNSVEVVYPGMHSDLGGGYPRGDQGKACGENDSLLLSQISLHEMYAAAFAAGAPLKVLVDSLPEDLRKDEWRQLSHDEAKGFDISPTLVQRFNAWRHLTLGLPPSAPAINDENAFRYEPIQAPSRLEKVIENQLAWLTAWRIERYAHGGYKTQPFYIASAANNADEHTDPTKRAEAEQERDKKQKAVEAERITQKAAAARGEFVLLQPGIKDFDAKLGQTQLREAAQEFLADYRALKRERTEEWLVTPIYGLTKMMYLLNRDDEYKEWLKIKTEGEAYAKVLFPKLEIENNRHKTPAFETKESRDAKQMQAKQTQTVALVTALFDDHVHDSRAWFLHNTFGSREPWSGYFCYRMIYFGDHCSKPLSPLMVGGFAVGVATLATGIGFIIKNKNTKKDLWAATGLFTALAFEVEVIDILSGKPLPTLSNIDELRAATPLVGSAVKALKTTMMGLQLMEAKSTIKSIWSPR